MGNIIRTSTMVGTSRNTRRSSRSNRCNQHTTLNCWSNQQNRVKNYSASVLLFRNICNHRRNLWANHASSHFAVGIDGGPPFILVSRHDNTVLCYLLAIWWALQKPQMVHLLFHVQKQYGEKNSSKGMDYLLTPKDTAKLREEGFSTSIWKMMMVAACVQWWK